MRVIPGIGTHSSGPSLRRISTALAGDLGKVRGNACASSTFSILPISVFVDLRKTVLPATKSDSLLEYVTTRAGACASTGVASAEPQRVKKPPARSRIAYRMALRPLGVGSG